MITSSKMFTQIILSSGSGVTKLPNRAWRKLCLDCPITEVSAIQNLKSGKSCGLDGILTDMLNSAGSSLTGVITNCFNDLFMNGDFPDLSSQSLIVPIHKEKFIPHVTDNNYRGVSLLSILGKCYTSILNKRLYDWLGDNENKIKIVS